jgi:hypothetical protein
MKGTERRVKRRREKFGYFLPSFLALASSPPGFQLTSGWLTFLPVFAVHLQP